MRQTTRFLCEPELRALRFDDFAQLLHALPYAHPNRILAQILARTGARIAEVDRMDPAMLIDGVQHWRPGKNQKGWRHEVLGAELCAEIAAYRRHARVPTTRHLSALAQHHIHYFDRDDRRVLGGVWLERTERLKRGLGFEEGWLLTFGRFRKTFQTVLFAYFFDKYGDAYIAAEMVAKRMKHSDKGITIKHYIEDYTQIQVDRWLAWLDLGVVIRQDRLVDFLDETSIREGRLHRRLRKSAEI